MSQETKHRRDDKAYHDTFTPAAGELLVDTDANGRVRSGGNGGQVGGFVIGTHPDDIANFFTAGDLSGTNTLTLSLPYPIEAYAKYQRVTGKIANTNTSTTVTLNVDSVGDVRVKKFDGDGNKVDPDAGDLQAGAIMDFTHDGTHWLMSGGIGGQSGPDFISSELSLATNIKIEVAHGLGGVPSFWTVVLRAVNTDGGYAVGDEISLNQYFEDASARAYTTYADATYLGFLTQDAYPYYNRRNSPGNTNRFNATDWKVVFRAWK